MTNTLLFIPRVGMGELLIILIVIILIFGPKRIPEIMRSFGEGIKNFRSGLSDTSTNNSDKKSKSDSDHDE